MNSNDQTDKKQFQRIDNEAIQWLIRIQRELTAREQDELFEWLAEDSLHGDRLNHHRKNWKRLNKIAAWRPEHSDYMNPDLLEKSKQSRPRIWWYAPALMAACLVIILSIQFTNRQNKQETQSITLVASEDNRSRLFDGSTVKLNERASVEVKYTEDSRKITLTEGEAFFDVIKDTARPFIVEVNDIQIIAVGTAFNVNFQNELLEVLVSEGKVRLQKTDGQVIQTENLATAQEHTLLSENQMATLDLQKNQAFAEINTISKEETMEEIIWQHGSIQITEEPLSFVVGEFNRLNTTQIVIEDQSILDMQISGSFRSDNIRGFVRLLELAFNVHVEYSPEQDRFILTSEVGLSE